MKPPVQIHENAAYLSGIRAGSLSLALDIIAREGKNYTHRQDTIMALNRVEGAIRRKMAEILREGREGKFTPGSEEELGS